MLGDPDDWGSAICGVSWDVWVGNDQRWVTCKLGPGHRGAHRDGMGHARVRFEADE